MTQIDIHKEVSDNFDFFQEKLPELMKTHNGKYALLRHCEVIGIFSTFDDACQAGDIYDDKIYSVQHITTKIIDLGFYSSCLVSRAS